MKSSSSDSEDDDVEDDSDIEDFEENENDVHFSIEELEEEAELEKKSSLVIGRMENHVTNGTQPPSMGLVKKEMTSSNTPPAPIATA